MSDLVVSITIEEMRERTWQECIAIASMLRALVIFCEPKLLRSTIQMAKNQAVLLEYIAELKKKQSGVSE